MERETHTARLVSITPDAEKQIVYMARVSNPSNQNNMETAPRLIKYLIKHKHWSPFEMASMQVEIETTRAVAAQVLRHRSFSFQEFSQRYSSVDQLGTVGLPHLRSQDLKNKQASHDDLDPEMVALMDKQIQQIYYSTFDYYEYLLSQGVAKEKVLHHHLQRHQRRLQQRHQWRPQQQQQRKLQVLVLLRLKRLHHRGTKGQAPQRRLNTPPT